VSQTVCTIPDYAAPLSDSHFAIAGSLPATVTIDASGLTTANGMPQLLAYSSSLALSATVTASSVAGNGSSATFPFPTTLGQGMYMFAVKNLGASGQYNVVDATYYSIGGTTALSSAFGVDAADISQTVEVCYSGGSGGHGGCGHSSSSSVTPIVTQYNSNQVVYVTPNTSSGGLSAATVAVGTRPVAAKLYGTYTAEWEHNYGGDTEEIATTFPSNAIVVNSGSNSVTLINFVNTSTVNITVGTQPMAVALNSAGTMAYVANYGSGTISEVNLSTQSVSRTVTAGPGLLGVAVDPSGSYVWTGGTNYLYKISLSTFAVVATQEVSGSVTSLAASNAQNELAYTIVQNCCTSSSTYAANELLLSNLTSPGSYAHASAAPYAPYTMNGTLPSAAVLPQATYVSAQFGNGMAASATPTGFVVYDVVSHQQLMTGNTPTPVRGIASDPSNTTVFFTVPDTNEYIVVPLPHF
jgi:YVTN family beta-propeller protein